MREVRIPVEGISETFKGHCFPLFDRFKTTIAFGDAPVVA
jgi:hypothetical protein